jgi:TctA family transporter
MLAPYYVPRTPQEYWLAVAAVALCGALAFFMLLWLSRLTITLFERLEYRWVCWGTLVVLLVLVAGITGWGGLAIAAAATGIGLIPLVFHSRRMNCLGVLLVPLLVGMAGVGPQIAVGLGLP